MNDTPQIRPPHGSVLHFGTLPAGGFESHAAIYLCPAESLSGTLTMLLVFLDEIDQNARGDREALNRPSLLAAKFVAWHAAGLARVAVRLGMLQAAELNPGNTNRDGVAVHDFSTMEIVTDPDRRCGGGDTIYEICSLGTGDTRPLIRLYAPYGCPQCGHHDDMHFTLANQPDYADPAVQCSQCGRLSDAAEVETFGASNRPPAGAKHSEWWNG